MTTNENKQGTALVIIDLQKKFFSTKYNGTKDGEQIAKRIISAVPEFRKAGIPIYVVRYFDLGMIFSGAARLQEYKTASTDRKIWKYSDDVFESSRIKSYLKRDNIGSIAVCGGNLPCCVWAACESGLKNNLKVHLLKDLTGSDRRRGGTEADDLINLARMGVNVTDTNSLLRTVGKAVIAVPSVR